MPSRKHSLLGLPIGHTKSAKDTVDFVSDALSNREQCIISFVNPSAFHLRLVDQAYSNALWHFDLILPDGIGVVKALRWINGVNVQRQSFDATSLFHPIMEHLNLRDKSLCIVGGRPGVALEAQQKMRDFYPNVNYLGALDGFRNFDDIVAWVLKHNPDVVLIGMGSPVQESILLRLKFEGFAGVGFTCGGFLDQFALNSQYYPQIINKLDLRWLYRLFCEPRRLGRRYLIHYQTFVFDVCSAIFERWLGRRKMESHQWLAKRYARVDG